MSASPPHGQVRGQPVPYGVGGVGEGAGEGVAGGQDGLGVQGRSERGLDGGGQGGEAAGGLLVADEGALPVVVLGGGVGHDIPFISSAAATAQLRLRLTARPWMVNHGVVSSQPHSSPGWSEARSPMTTLCAGTEVMYGDTRCR